MKTERICKNCGRILPERKRSFCSEDCKEQFYNTPRERACAVCGKVFPALRTRSICKDCLNENDRTKRFDERMQKKARKAQYDVRAASFEDYIAAWRRARQNGKNLHYGAWAAGLYKDKTEES